MKNVDDSLWLSDTFISQIIMNENLIREYVENSMAVFGFLASVPSRLQSHVFYQILEDAYAQSVLMNTQEATKDLLKAISAHICYKNNEENLLRDLFSDKTTEFATALRKGEFDSLSEHAMIEMPDIRLLYKAFSYFKWEGDGVWDLSNLEERIKPLITEHVNEQTQMPFQENAFEKLGFLTLMINVNRHLGKGEQAARYRSIFYMWYCEGQILDVVFNTMMKSKITSIKRGLLNYITEGCLKNRILCDVLNTKWNEYRTFNGMIANKFSFKTEDTHNEDVIERVMPLGQPDEEIFEKMKESNNFGFNFLYSYFVENNYLYKEETKVDDFIDVFTDPKGNEGIKRVVFHLKNEYHVRNLFHFFWQWYFKYCKKHNLTKKVFFKRFIKSLKLMVIKEGKEMETNGNEDHLNPVGGQRELYDELTEQKKYITKNLLKNNNHKIE